MLSGLKGDRLTDERVQCAKVAVKDSLTSKGRLEGFISKSEDFHRLMNFLEVSEIKWNLIMSLNNSNINQFMKNLSKVK